MYRLEELFPEGMDYTRVMSSDPDSTSNYYPEPIKKFYQFIESGIDSYIDSLFEEERKNIESELENVEGLIDIADKQREIHERYREIAKSDPRLKEIGAKLDDVLTKAMEELETKLKEETSCSTTTDHNNNNNNNDNDRVYTN